MPSDKYKLHYATKPENPRLKERYPIPTLKERREKATWNELKKIQDDLSNPCNRFLPDAAEPINNLRKKNESIPKLLSKADRHKMSFIHRACPNMHVCKKLLTWVNYLPVALYDY